MLSNWFLCFGTTSDHCVFRIQFGRLPSVRNRGVNDFGWHLLLSSTHSLLLEFSVGTAGCVIGLVHICSGRKRLASQFNFTYRYIDDVLSINNPDFENYLGQVYPPELEIKDTTESNTSASYLDLILSIGGDGQLRTSLYHKRNDFNFRITNFPFLSSNIPSSPAYGAFISQLIRYVRACSSYECFILRAVRLSNKLLGQRYVKERLKSSLRKFYGRYGDFTKKYEVPLSRMLHDILEDVHIQWHPPLMRHYTNFDPLLIWTLLPNLTFYRIVWGFHRTFATGAACQQMTLTLPGTWSCPTLGLACVLMSRPISPKLVLFPEFWVSNIPRYFCFASLCKLTTQLRVRMSLIILERETLHICLKLWDHRGHRRTILDAV